MQGPQGALHPTQEFESLHHVSAPKPETLKFESLQPNLRHVAGVVRDIWVCVKLWGKLAAVYTKTACYRGGRDAKRNASNPLSVLSPRPSCRFCGYRSPTTCAWMRPGILTTSTRETSLFTQRYNLRHQLHLPRVCVHLRLQICGTNALTGESEVCRVRYSRLIRSFTLVLFLL